MPICRCQVYQKRSIKRSKNLKVAWIINNIQKLSCSPIPTKSIINKINGFDSSNYVNENQEINIVIQSCRKI